jgi:hypothetical protein
LAEDDGSVFVGCQFEEINVHLFHLVAEIILLDGAACVFGQQAGRPFLNFGKFCLLFPE